MTHRSATHEFELSTEQFLDLTASEQVAVLLHSSPSERQARMRLLALDDAADVLQAAPEEARERLLDLLDVVAKREVTALLAYSEDAAGGLMDPRFVRLRPDLSVDEAISYLRRQAHDAVATLECGYVLDADQQLLGVVSLVRLFSSPPDRRVQEVMSLNPVTVTATMDQEVVSQMFRHHNLTAVPVLDEKGTMKGVVTLDDVVDVVDEEATEDMQRMGADGD